MYVVEQSRGVILENAKGTQGEKKQKTIRFKRSLKNTKLKAFHGTQGLKVFCNTFVWHSVFQLITFFDTSFDRRYA